MDKVRDILLYFVAALAIFSLLCAVYQAMQGENLSASVLGTIFVACTMIVFIPQLELLKVFGVEAKMREVKDTLTEAQVLTDKLNKLATINARVSYMLLGWGNRMDGPTARAKQSILDEVDKQLAEMKITPDERAAITKPFVQLVGVDLYYIYVQVMERFATVRRSREVAYYSQDKNEERTKRMNKFIEDEGAWMQRKAAGPFGDVNGYVFNDVIEKAIPTGWVSANDYDGAKAFARYLIKMFAECEKKGGYTPEAAEFYDKYRDLGGTDLKMKELFGVSMNDPN